MSTVADTALTVQWALHGKRPGDTEANRVLVCSYGDISRENFAEAITRFNPGTLDELPQVTVSWLVRRHPEQAGTPPSASSGTLAARRLRHSSRRSWACSRAPAARSPSVRRSPTER